MMFRVIALLLALTVSSSAQVVAPWQAGSYQPAPSGGGGFTGPGDITAFAHWYGLGCYSAAKATGSTNVATIIRASDSTTTNIVCLTNGKFDTATASTFCASTTCKFTTIFDQGTTGGLDVGQVTGASQPALTFNCSLLGTSQPCATFSGGQFLASAGAGYTQAQPFSKYFVGIRTGAFTSVGNQADDSGADTFGYDSSANTITCFGGSNLGATASDSAWHDVMCVASNASGKLAVDGSVLTTGSFGAYAPAGQNIQIGAEGAGPSNFLTGNGVEWGYAAGDTSASAGSLNSSRKTFWGY